jgi:purine-binding chemotaxis protein CheW
VGDSLTGEQWYAFPVESIAEVVHMAELSTTAGCPPSIEGFLNLRGSLAPVLSLRRLFGLGDMPPSLYSPLIVIRDKNTDAGGDSIALRADSVLEVSPLPEKAGLRTLSASDSYNSCARYAFTHRDRDVVLLAPDLLFDAKEQACLADLRRDAQRRLDGLLLTPPAAAPAE